MFTVLTGGAVPAHLHGTSDDTFYNHYSTIATVSQNWGLPSLGRWDCHANVFELVANKTGYVASSSLAPRICCLWGILSLTDRPIDR